MLTGNAISRAVRRPHVDIIYAILNTILVAKAHHIPLTTTETDEPKRAQQVGPTDPETPRRHRSTSQRQFGPKMEPCGTPQVTLNNV